MRDEGHLGFRDHAAGLAGVPLMILPFLNSAFVPAGKMGPGARQFAEYQPFTKRA
ncbi:hypothetical protein [Nonomuraea jabiensis]|uniref:hypothetical protein n=1 Tax=Nonomuraea jabiensis TaxID=882448 RepID=UPI00369D5C6A